MLAPEVVVPGLALAVLPCMLALFYAFMRFEPSGDPVADTDL